MAATSRASPTSGSNDSGMVTIEAAISLCAFISVLALVLAAMSMVFDELRCIDAAREAARLVARGEQDGAANVVHRIAPADATYAVTTSGDGIVVAVRDPDSLLPGVDLHADAYAVQEPTDDTEPATPAPPGSGAVADDGPAVEGPPHSGGHDVPAAPATIAPSGSAVAPKYGDGTTTGSGPAVVPGPGSGEGPRGERPTAIPGTGGKDRQAADGLSRSTGGGRR